MAEHKTVLSLEDKKIAVEKEAANKQETRFSTFKLDQFKLLEAWVHEIIQTRQESLDTYVIVDNLYIVKNMMRPFLKNKSKKLTRLYMLACYELGDLYMTLTDVQSQEYKALMTNNPSDNTLGKRLDNIIGNTKLSIQEFEEGIHNDPSKLRPVKSYLALAKFTKRTTPIEGKPNNPVYFLQKAIQILKLEKTLPRYRADTSYMAHVKDLETEVDKATRTIFK